MRRTLFSLILAAGAWGLYRLQASGAVALDVGVGRKMRALGPVTWEIAAPRELVFDVIETPYMRRAPRALASKLLVLERGTDMVLAAHYTDVRGRVTTTVETVRFERPERIDFRLVRGPVPHVVESFVLRETDHGTSLTWKGELGTDFWDVGAWWGDRVATHWEKAVQASMHGVTAEAERRAR